MLLGVDDAVISGTAFYNDNIYEDVLRTIIWNHYEPTEAYDDSYQKMPLLLVKRAVDLISQVEFCMPGPKQRESFRVAERNPCVGTDGR